MKTLKRYEGYYAGTLSYEWELLQKSEDEFVLKVNGCKWDTYTTLHNALYWLHDQMKSFLNLEQCNLVTIKGV